LQKVSQTLPESPEVFPRTSKTKKETSKVKLRSLPERMSEGLRPDPEHPAADLSKRAETRKGGFAILQFTPLMPFFSRKPLTKHKFKGIVSKPI